MARISLLTVSLAAKCRLLFGLAVVIIVAATLLVPWIRMRDLVHESNIEIARQMGRLAIARSDLVSGNWELSQQALNRWWPNGAGQHGLNGPPPLFLALSDPSHPAPPPSASPDVATAIQILSEDPARTEGPPGIDASGDDITYRITLPVRSVGGTYPQGTLLGVVAVEYAAPSALGQLWINNTLSLMAGGLAGILAVLVFYLITHKLILFPVRELKQVTEEVSQGNHGIRSTIATGDEFEGLARAFNAMLAHLENSEIELKTINKSLDTRLGELAERNLALFEADKLKGQFLANVSHELRTPLTSIIGFAELLREAAMKEGGRLLRYSENIVSSGRMLLGIINDLLDLAKIEAGKLELRLSQVDLKEMAANLADFMQPVADKKRVRLVTDIHPDFPSITSDSARIQQILYNLLSNAVKFTPDGGHVELSLQILDHERVSLAVKDTGVGIPPNELASIFEKFRQLDGSMTREHSGTGLGLPISRELAMLLGGTILVTSGVGVGSVFTVILPIAAPEKTVMRTEVELT